MNTGDPKREAALFRAELRVLGIQAKLHQWIPLDLGRARCPERHGTAGEYRAIFPGIDGAARVSRKWLVGNVSCLAGEAGIRQFLDVGGGLPSTDNTHEVAQRIAPDARVVYVDHDPMVVHSRTRRLKAALRDWQTRHTRR